MNNLTMQMEQYLFTLEQLSKTNLDKAREIARQSLIQTGIIDTNENLYPPYNGERVNEIDFTVRPREIQYTKRRIRNVEKNRRTRIKM